MVKMRTSILLLLVLIVVSSGLSLVQVRPASSSAKLWIAADFNLRQLRNQAVHYYEGVRLLYDFARQVRALQDKQDAFGPAPGTEVHRCSMRLTNSSDKAPAENPGRLAREARQISTLPVEATSRVRPGRVPGTWPKSKWSFDLGLVEMENEHFTSRRERILLSRSQKVRVLDPEPSSTDCECHSLLTAPVTCALGECICVWSAGTRYSRPKRGEVWLTAMESACTAGNGMSERNS
jgi:hypothetical protein